MVLIDSWSETNRDDSTPLVVLHPSAAGGQVSSVGNSFTCSVAGYNLSSAKFYLQKVGTPVGNLVAILYAVTGTYGTDNCKPTGIALATSNTVAMGGLSTSWTLTEFTFPVPRYGLAINYYFIQCQVQSATTIDTTTNYVRVGEDAGGGHSGNYSQYVNGEWISYTLDDCFYVYGELGVVTVKRRLLMGVGL